MAARAINIVDSAELYRQTALRRGSVLAHLSVAFLRGNKLTYQRLLCLAASLILALVLAACVEGGGSNSGDINPSSPPSEGVITGPNSFFTFPNPLLQDDGTLQVVSVSYATAYYEAIDPLNERDTLAKFKAKNGFDTGTGTQHQVVFGDVRDLGYGRRMTARQNPDGSLAFFVENYIVRLGPAYA